MDSVYIESIIFCVCGVAGFLLCSYLLFGILVKLNEHEPAYDANDGNETDRVSNKVTAVTDYEEDDAEDIIPHDDSKAGQTTSADNGDNNNDEQPEGRNPLFERVAQIQDNKKADGEDYSATREGLDMSYQILGRKLSSHKAESKTAQTIVPVDEEEFFSGGFGEDGDSDIDMRDIVGGEDEYVQSEPAHDDEGLSEEMPDDGKTLDDGETPDAEHAQAAPDNDMDIPAEDMYEDIPEEIPTETDIPDIEFEGFTDDADDKSIYADDIPPDVGGIIIDDEGSNIEEYRGTIAKGDGVSPVTPTNSKSDDDDDFDGVIEEMYNVAEENKRRKKEQQQKTGQQNKKRRKRYRGNRKNNGKTGAPDTKA